MMSGIDGITRECSACRKAVPLGPFCGRCGADQRREVTPFQHLIRPNAFIAAHRQSVFLPLITSTLFPHLADRDRVPFRIGLLLAAAALVVASAFKLLLLGVVLASFGIALLFVVYLWRSDIFRDIPSRAMILTPLVGVALSVAWWLWTGQLVANSIDVPIAAGFQLTDVVNLGLAVSAGGTVLMFVPAVVVRLLRLPTIESLDGFVIGALGALACTTAGTLTWLAPPFIAGLLDGYDPWRLLSRAMLYGVFDPLTAAAAGGTMGLLLWFRPGRQAMQPAKIRLTLGICVLVTTSCYLGIYVSDALGFPRNAETAVNLVITVLALLTLRIAMQIAVLHEAPDAASFQPVLCIHCDEAVPDMPFCPQCGGAARASSRSARRLRRETVV